VKSRDGESAIAQFADNAGESHILFYRPRGRCRLWNGKV